MDTDNVNSLYDVIDYSESILWEKADKLLSLSKGYTDSQLAVMYKMSKSAVRKACKASETFPEESRALDLSYKIHEICASSNDPELWLNEAINNSYTERALRTAIKLAEGVSDEDWLRRGESILYQWNQWKDSAPKELVNKIKERIC